MPLVRITGTKDTILDPLLWVVKDLSVNSFFDSWEFICDHVMHSDAYDTEYRNIASFAFSEIDRLRAEVHHV
jgi:hypothetical protein